MDRTATARQFKDATRGRHTLKSGREIETRYVSIDKLAARAVLPPGVIDSETAGEAGAAVGKDPATIARIIDAVLAAGLLNPPIWEGPDDECPDDHILISDLGADRLEAFECVMRNSEVSAALVRGVAFRPGESDPGGSDRPDGDEAGNDGAGRVPDVAGGVGV